MPDMVALSNIDLAPGDRNFGIQLSIMNLPALLSTGGRDYESAWNC